MDRDTFWQTAWARLSANLSEREEFPRPLLAHYCSISVAEKILIGQNFWLSNPLFMNDLEELRFGFNTGSDIVLPDPDIKSALRSADRHRKFLDLLETSFEAFNSKHAFDCYVACFSEHLPEDYDGKLSMWRAYGAVGDGAAIVFDVNAFSKPDTQGNGLILGKVHYGTALERTARLKEKVQTMAKFIRDVEPTDDNLDLLAAAFVEQIKLMAIFSKHSGFKEEEEWRLVYIREHDKEDVLVDNLHYFVGERGIEPKLKLPLTGDPLRTGSTISVETLVERILLGPCVSSPLAKMSFNRMLELNRKADLAKKVHASSIPLRPTRRA